MDTEEQYRIQRDNIGYRRTILDTEGQYWIQKNNIGYRRTILDTEEQHRLQICSNHIQKDFGYRRIIFRYNAVTEDQYLNTDRQQKEFWIYII